MNEYLLKDISSKIGSGATPTGGKESYKGGRFSLIRSQNVLDMAFSYEGLAHIDEEQAHKLDGVEVCSRDILFNITGDSICRCCIVPDDVLPARVNQHVAIIRTPNVDSRYVMYYLQYLKPYLMKICGGGSSRNALTKENLEALTIPIPNNAEKIANVLSTIDLKIKTNNTIISELESMAKDIYDYWFVQFDFPNENGKPYKSSGGKMVWNEELKREIPDGWKPTLFGDLFSFVKGRIPEELSDIPSDSCSSPYLTIDVANDGNPQYCNPSSMVYCDGQVVMVMDGAASGDVYLGNKGSLGSTFSMLPSKRQDVSNALLFMLLQSNMVTYKRANTGSTVPHANRSFIERMKTALPDDLSSFVSILDQIFDHVISLRLENRELKSLRDWLLPMLMNGQVKVGGVA